MGNKIVIFNPAGYIGGAERGIFEIISSLNDKYKIKVIHPLNGELGKKLGKYSAGIELKKITGISRKGFSFRDILFSVSDINLIFRKINELDPSIVISNGIKAHLILLIYKIFYPQKKFIPYIRDATDCSNFINKALYFLIKKYSDWIIITSELLKDNYKLKSHYTILPNPVKKSVHIVNNRKKDFITIGVVANFAPLKGIEDILLSYEFLQAKLNKKIKIIIAGSNIYKTNKEFYNNYTNNLYNLKSRLSNKNIIFKKFDFNNMNEFYSQIDILVNSSRNEGFGRAVSEAIMYDVPFVTTECGYWQTKHFELLKDYIYIPGNIDDLVKKIQYALIKHEKYYKMKELIIENKLKFSNYRKKFLELIDDINT